MTLLDFASDSPWWTLAYLVVISGTCISMTHAFAGALRRQGK
jgi:hypothetical protein